MSNEKAILAIAIMSAVTILIRFAPFLLLGRKETPKTIVYLGRVLPYAIMGVLPERRELHSRRQLSPGVYCRSRCSIELCVEAKHSAEYHRRHGMLYAPCAARVYLT